MKRRYRILAISTTCLLALWMVAGYVGAYILTAPRPRTIESPAEIGGVPVQDILLTAADGNPVSGWYMDASDDRAVVFVSGIGNTRRHGLRQGEYYAQRGYSVVLIDQRGQGMSGPAQVSVGWNERKDLLAAYEFLREKGYEHIGAHGISMGASAITYSMQEEPDYAFVVLESCYDSIEHALANRAAMFFVPYAVTLPMRWFSQQRIGVSMNDLRPLDHIGGFSAPTLMFAGDSEPELKVSETLALFEACGAEEKFLHIIKGAEHQHHLMGRFAEQYLPPFETFLDKLEASWQPAPAAVAQVAPITL